MSEEAIISFYEAIAMRKSDPWRSLLNLLLLRFVQARLLLLPTHIDLVPKNVNPYK